MRVLIMTDNPNISTGMGRVGREIGLGLWKRGVDVHYLGWFGKTENKMPFPVYSTTNMYYGADVFVKVVEQVRPDIVLTVGDRWMVEYIANPERVNRFTRQTFSWVGYMPIDGNAQGDKLPDGWGDTVRSMDKVVAYTYYGQRIIRNTCPELDVEVLYHGVDTKTYYPIKPEVATKYKKNLGILEDTVIFLVVARNQFRKNIPEILKAWKIFKGRGKYNAKIWLHMWFSDPMGWKLDQIICDYGLEKDVLFFEDIAHGADNTKLLAEEKLNTLYNIGDVFLLQSGEGFGLPTIEAMACAKPVILLDHSANTELGQDRGELVKVLCTMAGKYSTERPYPDLNDMADKMEKLYKDEALRVEYGKKGLAFAQSMTWDAVTGTWYKLLDKFVNPLRYPVRMREVCNGS